MQPVRLLIISMLLVFSLSAKSKSAKCFENGKVRVLVNSKYQNFHRSYCVNHSRLKVISLGCLKSNSCLAITKYKNLETFPNVSGDMGSPHHKKCYLLNGEPRFYEFSTAEGWQKVAVCEFEDESFISVFN